MSAVASSRLPVGSSASTSAGRLASARATATRCCSPPDSWLGRWVRRWPRPSAVSRSLGARVGVGARGAVDQLRQDDILDRVEIGQQMVELVDEAERVAAQHRCGRAASSFAASSPAIRIEPSNPPSSRPTACSSVDLPEPDGPSSATISPGATVEVDAAQDVDRRLALREAARQAARLQRTAHS